MKTYGAISVKGGRCSYGKAIDALFADTDYMRIYGEFAGKFQMTDRSIIVGEDY